ncbi:MAG: glycosyltransferase family 39 protein [Deltaproteobacteria bacterium]|nr:glycosyltransferase family 39 protein [Deltaproteobacteria bacterium]
MGEAGGAMTEHEREGASGREGGERPTGDAARADLSARALAKADPTPREVVSAWWRRVRAAFAAWGPDWRAWRAAAAADRVRRSVRARDRVAGLPVWGWLLLATAVALGVRLYYFFVQAGIHYPDEMMQYLEPAQVRMHGFGWLPWEFNGGVRNWILPGYYGGLMELGEALGLRGYTLHSALVLHNALLTLLLVPAGYRLGRAVGRGDERLGILAAFAMAAFPPFAYFAPHTLSEVHGLLFTTWAYALWAEQVAFPDEFGRDRKAFLVGLLLGAAFLCRYTLVIFIPLVALDYNFRSRFRELGWLAVGLGVAMAVLGVVDAATWGRPFHSLIGYFQYNVLKDGSAEHGIMPRWFYWNEAFVGRLGFARWLLLGPMVLTFWRHWRMILAWVIPFAAMTAIKHKEERFLLSIWPFVLVGALSGMLVLADALRHVGEWKKRRWFGPVRHAAVACLLAAVCVWAFVGTRKLPMRWLGGVFAAQSWVGQQPDATGLLLDERQHLNGGYMIMNRNIPLLQYNATIVQHRIYNYVAVHDEKLIRTMEGKPEFRVVGQFEDVMVFRRTDGLVGGGERAGERTSGRAVER